MRISLIDHNDSFTYNIVRWLRRSPLVTHLDVFSCRHPLLELEQLLTPSDLMILGPGPYAPRDYPNSLALLQRFAPIKPILGICLGMQLLFEWHGIPACPYVPPFHGKISRLVWHEVAAKVSAGLENMSIARYHSLGFDTNLAYKNLQILAHSQEDQKVMMVQHQLFPWILGLQFHPESFMTTHQDLFLANMLNWFAVLAGER